LNKVGKSPKLFNICIVILLFSKTRERDNVQAHNVFEMCIFCKTWMEERGLILTLGS